MTSNDYKSSIKGSLRNLRIKIKYILSDILWHNTILLVDNGSKHSAEIINFLRDKKVIIVRVDPYKFDLKRLDKDKINGIILTGGSTNFIGKKREFNFSVIRLFRDKPILGICLGHEFIIEYYKGSLYEMNWRAQGYSYIYVRKDNKLISGKEKLYVYKGHSFAAGILPDYFEQLAWSSDCDNEMIEHKLYPHYGVQFHPEMNFVGHEILDNFLKVCKKTA
jgi:GMP synthase-like glutamine amidotransferase